MRSRILLCGIVVGVAIILGGASTAFAQATRTWVSGVGDDANPCSRTAPCKTFAGAISKTAAGGEIDTLDPGGFGAVTIVKSMTIDAHAVGGGILVSGGSFGITVNAGATDVVTLRGLSIINTGVTSSAGVRFIAGGALHVEDSVISGFQGTGALAIDFEPAVGATLFVTRLQARNNAGGILVGGAGNSTAVVSRSSFFNDTIALHAMTTSRLTIYDSVLSGSSTAAITVEGTADVSMDHGLVSANGVGVNNIAPTVGSLTATVRLSEVMLGHNGTGLMGNVASFGNNRLNAGNGTNGVPSVTLPQQ